MKIKIKKLDNRITLPEYATEGSAGLDLRACIDNEIVITPGKTAMVGTGIAIHLDDPGYVAKIYPRSGLGIQGLVLANLVGVIDSDYQGEIKVCLWNRRDSMAFKIKPFDRIAQLLIEPIIKVGFDLVEEFELSERGHGGFGSSGIA